MGAGYNTGFFIIMLKYESWLYYMLCKLFSGQNYIK